MIAMRNFGGISIIIVLALATVAPDHGGGGGGGGDYVETSDPSGGTFVETSDSFVETIVTSDSFVGTIVTGDAFGVTVYTPSSEDAAAAQDFLAGLDFSALDPDAAIPDGYAQAIKDSNLQNLDPAASNYTLQKYNELQKDLQIDPAAVMDLLLNIPAQDIRADTLQHVWQIPSAADYAKMSAPQAQSTLAVLAIDFTIKLQSDQKGDWQSLLDNIAAKGELVEATAANALAGIFDPATLADQPLTQQGLSNWFASVEIEISDAMLNATQIITADYGIADFADFSAKAIYFDTVDNDVPDIQVDPLALQVYG